MLYFLLTPICFAAFSLLIRHSQRAGLNLTVVGAANYITAALVFGALCAHQGLVPHPQVTTLGLLAGIIYVAGFFVLVATMRDRGVSLASALMQLSVLMPMLASLLIWHERLTAMKVVGATLCLLAMPLIVLDQGLSSAPLTWRRLALFAGMFLANGLAMTSAKAFQALGVPDELYAFSTLLFGTAALGSVAIVIATRARPTPAALLWGALLGLSNLGANLCLITALRHYPGFVVFPAVASLSLAAVAIFAALAWRETPGKLGWLGLAVTVGAAILANL